MIHKTLPKDFNPKFEVVSCYVECGREILLLHRQEEKSQGGKWGVPAGKREKEELVYEAMVRETQEETGLLVSPSQLDYIETVFVKYPDYDFVYHVWRTKLKEKPKIIINKNEHQSFLWATPDQALNMNLVDDLDQCIKSFYQK